MQELETPVGADPPTYHTPHPSRGATQSKYMRRADPHTLEKWTPWLQLEGSYRTQVSKILRMRNPEAVHLPTRTDQALKTTSVLS